MKQTVERIVHGESVRIRRRRVAAVQADVRECARRQLDGESVQADRTRPSFTIATSYHSGIH